jgi:DNA-binding transcriptional ArsR family regulator
LSVVFLGFGFHFRITGHGMVHCERCGGDRKYRQCVGRRWMHLAFLPLLPLDRIDEHVQCTTCGTRYRREVLAVPTSAQMLAALPAGTRAAVLAMLCAGDERNGQARARAIETIKRAGESEYGETALRADLARTCPPGELAAALGTLATQLTMPAHEWFLAAVVRVGLADGQLSHEERCSAREVAALLGMTPAQAHGVISMTEEGAAAG